MNYIESNLHLINEKIISQYNKIEDIGVLNGLAGLALFNLYYCKNFKSDPKSGFRILESSIEKVNQGYEKPTYCNGVLGLGWTINHLVDYKIIHKSNLDVLIEIDKYIYLWMLETIDNNNYDFLHGAMGCVNYFIDRYNLIEKSISRKIIDNSILLFLNNLNSLLNDLKSFSAGSNEIAIKMGFENKIFFGLAHGLSSFIFLLNKISVISKFKTESLKLAEQYISFLLKYKDKHKSGISLFPSYLDSNGDVKYFSGLSWCTGDLGIGINLLNSVAKFNHKDEYKMIAIEILKHSANRKSLNESLLKTNTVCHGHFGAFKIFSKAYNITKDTEFKIASEYWLNLALGDLNIDVNSDLTILTGLSGIGLTLIDTINPKPTCWDKCLLLD